MKHLTKIVKPLTELLAKEPLFVFTDECHKVFCEIKQALIYVPIIQPPDGDLPFEIICDASDHVMGAILGNIRTRNLL